MWDQEIYLKTLNFASFYHRNQLIPGTDNPYISHPVSVCMEIMSAFAFGNAKGNCNLAVQCALLHDIIEDTDGDYDIVESTFGSQVAKGVIALTKNSRFETKEEQMTDSLKRIKNQPCEIWMVKMADRITNLQKPPHYWTNNKKAFYLEEAKKIYDALFTADAFLAARLESKISNYNKYL